MVSLPRINYLQKDGKKAWSREKKAKAEAKANVAPNPCVSRPLIHYVHFTSQENAGVPDKSIIPLTFAFAFAFAAAFAFAFAFLSLYLRPFTQLSSNHAEYHPVRTAG